MQAESGSQPAPLAEALSQRLGNMASLVGGLGVLLAEIVRRALRRDFDRDELFRNLHRMGIKSLPIVTVTALFTGGIMVIQAAPIVQRYGAYGLLGWGAGFGTLREIAPLLTALMINGRVGANNTAELGTMAVTEQIDALRALAIDPIGFLVAPRFLAIVVTLFLSTIFSDALALLGAAYAGAGFLGVEPGVFYRGLTTGLLGFGDVAHGLVKSVVFGVVIGLSSCHFGLGTSGGAPGVGRSVNATVVASAAGIFVLDYLLSFAIA
ncbi:MAG TPA: ABC transporter permease [Polyangiaceae bacterium]|jgi:phospholipid/cholesterol/gamma-HCH transport system permease protein|nr:ABC transporter permease [Polyangiaceae bacterium]